MIYPDLPKRALSIRQPWVWAILYMGKRIENRPRRFHYRGPICLHASIGCTNNERRNFFEFINAEFPMTGIDEGARQIRIGNAIDEATARGGIVGVADLVDCIDDSDSPWFFGPYGLTLENVRPVEFIPVKGALGLFDWRRNLKDAA